METSKYRRQGPVYTPASFKPAPTHPERKEPFYGTIARLVKVMLRAQGVRVFVDEAERIPATGGALLAFNHTGYFDFILGGVPAHRHNGRLVRFMSKNEIFDMPVVGKAMRLMHHISVDRDAGSQSLDDAIASLCAGNLVGIFPEATISRSFEVKELKTGAVRIAHTADVPLIPVAIWGSQRIWTKGLPKNLLHPKVPVWVRVGEPIHLSGDPEADTATLARVLSDMVVQLRKDYTAEFGPISPGQPWMPAAMGGSAPTPERAALLALEEKERRQAERERKREDKLHRLDLRADRKAMDVLRSRGWLGRMRARIVGAIEERRGR